MKALCLLTFVVAVAYGKEDCLDFTESFLDLQSEDTPLIYNDASNKFATPVLYDQSFMETVTRLNRERLSERVVHSKGTGAFGYFVTTNNNMSRICKADMFDGFEKKTPVVCRISAGAGDRGSSDFMRDTRGLSCRFYTNEGNWDLFGFHIPCFFNKDPFKTHTIVHAVKRSPDTNLYDMNKYWDAITLIPDSLHFFIRLHSDEEGIPASFQNMPGFPVHTYQVKNNRDESHFVRFHFIPDAGIKTLSADEAAKRGAADPDGMVRDLHDAIKKGNFASWTVSVQILNKDDMRKNGHRYTDVTRIISTDEFPLHEIGKIFLNRNAEHFQNEIEKLALCPCNLIPGVLGGLDNVFEARSLIYHDTHSYRLGKNHNKIPVNRPLNTISTCNRDGMPPLGNNEGDAINYYPNSFGGPQPYDKDIYNNKKCTGDSGLLKIIESPDVDNFDQIADFYNGLSSKGKTALINNLATAFKTVKNSIRERFATQCLSIHPDLGNRFAKAMNITLPNSGQ